MLFPGWPLLIEIHILYLKLPVTIEIGVLMFNKSKAFICKKNKGQSMLLSTYTFWESL